MEMVYDIIFVQMLMDAKTASDPEAPDSTVSVSCTSLHRPMNQAFQTPADTETLSDGG